MAPSLPPLPWTLAEIDRAILRQQVRLGECRRHLDERVAAEEDADKARRSAELAERFLELLYECRAACLVAGEPAR